MTVVPLTKHLTVGFFCFTALRPRNDMVAFHLIILIFGLIICVGMTINGSVAIRAFMMLIFIDLTLNLIIELTK